MIVTEPQNINARRFIPAFQASAASGSEDFNTQEAKAMQTKHISDCFSVEKMPSRPVRDIKFCFGVFSFFLHPVRCMRELRLTCHLLRR